MAGVSSITPAVTDTFGPITNSTAPDGLGKSGNWKLSGSALGSKIRRYKDMRRLLAVVLLVWMPAFSATRRSAPRSERRDTAGRSRYCSSCERDANDRIRRSSASRNEFRREHPCPATGETSVACPGYVIEPPPAAEAGGADSPNKIKGLRSNPQRGIGRTLRFDEVSPRQEARSLYAVANDCGSEGEKSGRHNRP